MLQKTAYGLWALYFEDLGNLTGCFICETFYLLPFLYEELGFEAHLPFGIDPKVGMGPTLLFLFSFFLFPATTAVAAFYSSLL